MALKGLKKDDRSASVDAEAFIAGAKKRVDDLKPKRERRYQRFMFSLTPEISQTIDELTLAQSGFKVSRSDVVKAAVLLLEQLEKEDSFKFNTALRNALLG